MAKVKYTDNAASLLTATLNNVDDPATLSITAGDGAKFPALSAGQWFPVVVVKTTKAFEKMKCTARSGDSLTVTRGQGGTTLLSFAIGDVVYLGPTKEFMDELLLVEDAQNGKPHYCGVAGGSANALTLLGAPTVGSYVDGLELAFVALADNTNAVVVVNVDGLGNKNIKDAGGAALGVGVIKSGGNYRIQYNGTAGEFRIVSGIIPTSVPGDFTVGGQLFLPGGLDIIPKNTKMLFINSAAPPGWTFDATQADRVFRGAATVGAGTTQGGTWTISGLSMAHTHPISFNSSAGIGTETQAVGQTPGIATMSSSHYHTVVGNTAAASTSTVSHTPGWRPAYVDTIVCSMNRGP